MSGRLYVFQWLAVNALERAAKDADRAADLLMAIFELAPEEDFYRQHSANLRRFAEEMRRAKKLLDDKRENEL